MSVDAWLEILERLDRAAERKSGELISEIYIPLLDLADFYAYLHEMGQGAIKDPRERDQQLAIVRSWQEDAVALDHLLKGS